MDQYGNVSTENTGEKDAHSEIIRLASKVESLEWHLNQMEVDHQMHEVLLEQMTQFLERVHISLDGKYPDEKEIRQSCSGISRSKSTHYVNKTLERINGYQSVSCLNHNSKSLSSKDFTLTTKKNQLTEFINLSRRSSDTLVDVQYTPQKLADEAFRLLRIAQSVQSTCDTVNDRTQTFHQDSKSNSDEKINLANGAWKAKVTNGKSFMHIERLNYSEETLTTSHVDATETSKSEEANTILDKELNFPLEKKFSNGSTDIPFEIESGFSSFNSFQDVGLPLEVWSTINTRNVNEKLDEQLTSKCLTLSKTNSGSSWPNGYYNNSKKYHSLGGPLDAYKPIQKNENELDEEKSMRLKKISAANKATSKENIKFHKRFDSVGLPTRSTLNFTSQNKNIRYGENTDLYDIPFSGEFWQNKSDFMSLPFESLDDKNINNPDTISSNERCYENAMLDEIKDVQDKLKVYWV